MKFIAIFFLAIEWITWAITLFLGFSAILTYKTVIAPEKTSGNKELLIIGVSILTGCLTILFFPINKFFIIGSITISFLLSHFYLLICQFNTKSFIKESPDSIKVNGKKKYTAVRWIILLPGCLLCGFLVSWPAHWIAMFAMSASAESLLSTMDGNSIAILSLITDQDALERIILAFLFPYTVVKSSAWIAPSGKYSVALITASIISILIPISYYYALQAGHAQASSDPNKSFKILLNMGAPLLAIFIISEELKKASSAKTVGETEA